MRTTWRVDLAVGIQAAVDELDRVDVDTTQIAFPPRPSCKARRDASLRLRAAAELEVMRAELARATGTQGGRLTALGAGGTATPLLAMLCDLLLDRIVDPEPGLRPASRSSRAVLANLTKEAPHDQ
jgi:hypothetical protein